MSLDFQKSFNNLETVPEVFNVPEKVSDCEKKPNKDSTF